MYLPFLFLWCTFLNLFLVDFVSHKLKGQHRSILIHCSQRKTSQYVTTHRCRLPPCSDGTGESESHPSRSRLLPRHPCPAAAPSGCLPLALACPSAGCPTQDGGWSVGLLSVQLHGAREVLGSPRRRGELVKSKSERSGCAEASSASLVRLNLSVLSRRTRAGMCSPLSKSSQGSKRQIRWVVEKHSPRPVICHVLSRCAVTWTSASPTGNTLRSQHHVLTAAPQTCL